MNGNHRRRIKTEIEKERVEGEVLAQGIVKLTVKSHELNERGELETIVDTQLGVLGCGHYSAQVGGRCGRCRRTLCAGNCSKVVCYGCGRVSCAACLVLGYSPGIVYHRGWCRLTSFFTRLIRG